ncbi:UDP-N-acetylmuramoyl-L-alanine--D-glutamate ligase [uncultured Sphingomonas sp.]|uniref:UDP-N-acetylmuramoyl-L-alanine--D-glutamate ligase n=1 Tax=uncultured Sphingomonas sp. TaxID=158754 RepID=UPI00260863EF|nr:UDP-N-acetylmuramoyl-L-alanine--D-glutamate ligase [uncultured Sphingomonas sp.]
MITSRAWAGKRFAVLGLARSGAATVRALLAGGAKVLAWDSDAAKREALAGEEVPSSVAFGAAPHPPIAGATGPSLSPGGRGVLRIAPIEDLRDFDAFVVSPGVPLNTHPLAAKAAQAGVPVIGDIELFAQGRADLPPHKVVGITGTNGKSTTTALIHHILDTAGVPARMGGNIGLPILAQEPLPAGGVYVLELSSYQIDLMQSLDCDVAVLLNVTPDHLDRYDGFDAYAASKARLFAMQSDGHVAIVGTGDAASAAIAATLSPERLTVIPADVAMDQSGWPSLKGPHNAQNAFAAIAAARALGVGEDAIAAALASFQGLAHRMERVAERDGVIFVNDSKATNPESAAPALGAFARIHWIVGGKRKGDDLEPCAPYFGNVAAAYTIGEAGPLFFDLLQGRVPVVEQAVTLERAVAHAAAAALPGDVVLLSPACASFDQFRDFEARGAAFRAAVEALS